MKYKISICKGRAGRIAPDDIIEEWEEEHQEFGFYWWFWKPSFNSNGGKFSRGECIDVSVKWFCFWFGFIFWPVGERKNCQGQIDPTDV